MRVRRTAYASSELVKVADAQSFQNPLEPPLMVGNRVQLNSGGPPCLVLDSDGRQVTIGWPGGELAVPRACVHRVKG
jgi:hypothetical protein